MKNTLISSAVILLLGLTAGFVYVRNTPKILPDSELSPTSSPVLSATTAASPRAANYKSATTASVLQIPKLKIEAGVESVGLDKQGNMDVPKNAQNVGWYNLGVKPGEKGNVVMAGHFDTVSGAPAVFYKLTELVEGDEIKVKDEKGEILIYAVTEQERYLNEEFPLQEVFGVTEKYRMNLITCSGQFNNAANNYSHRTVVSSELLR